MGEWENGRVGEKECPHSPILPLSHSVARSWLVHEEAPPADRDQQRLPDVLQSQHPTPNAQVDRDNRYLWRFNSRRAESEVVRDGILHAAGILDLTMGGPELDNRAEDGRRRSLYYSVYAEDGGSMRFLETFDAPDTCDGYRRMESII